MVDRINRFSLLSLPGKVVRGLRGKSDYRRRVELLYKEKSYLDAYSAHTDMRVERDPHSAIGPSWEKMGRLQFEFLVGMGMKPRHRMLDIGCGTLRGGRHAIRYLDSGNYAGIDLSPKAVEYGKKLIENEGLSDKQARIIVNANNDLKFKEFEGETFDFILAQSVFTHLMPEHIEECFRHVVDIMHTGSVFYFTYHRGAAYKQKKHKGFIYPWSFFVTLADRVGVSLEDCENKYDHPTGQCMVSLRRN